MKESEREGKRISPVTTSCVCVCERENKSSDDFLCVYEREREKYSDDYFTH